jgi:hypothetical protein
MKDAAGGGNGGQPLQRVCDAAPGSLAAKHPYARNLALESKDRAHSDVSGRTKL